MVADSSLPAPKKMLRLSVIVKARDSFKGKPMVDVLISLYKPCKKSLMYIIVKKLETGQSFSVKSNCFFLFKIIRNS